MEKIDVFGQVSITVGELKALLSKEPDGAIVAIRLLSENPNRLLLAAVGEVEDGTINLSNGETRDIFLLQLDPKSLLTVVRPSGGGVSCH